MNSSPPPRHGVLLINIGSPATLSLRDVAVYLRKFLSDRRVIDINPALRFLLVNFLIVPFRTRKARQAYSKIWRNDGSPLLAFSHACQRALNAKLPAHITTAVAMRYSQPDIATAVAQLCAQNISQLTIMPLFPQYSSAANGSAIAASLQAINQQANIPRLQAINCFYDQPFYQQALGDVIATHLQKNKKSTFYCSVIMVCHNANFPAMPHLTVARPPPPPTNYATAATVYKPPKQRLNVCSCLQVSIPPPSNRVLQARRGSSRGAMLK